MFSPKSHEHEIWTVETNFPSPSRLASSSSTHSPSSLPFNRVSTIRRSYFARRQAPHIIAYYPTRRQKFEMDPNQPPMNIHQPYSAQINPANPSSAALPTAPPASTTQVINPFATSPVRPPPSAASVPYPSYSSSQIKNPFSGTNPSAPAPAPALASAPAAASHKVNLATVLNAGPMPTSIGASSATQAMADFMKRRLQNANDGAQAQGQAQGQAQVQAQAQAGTLNLNPGTGGQAQVLNSNHNNNFSSAKPSTAGIVDLTSSRDEPSPVPHLNVPVTIPPTAPTQNQTSDQTAVVKIDSAAPAPVTNPPTSSLASNQTNLINFMHHIMKQQQGEGGGGGGGGGSGNPLSASLLGAAGVTQSSKEQSARIMQDMQKVIQERLKQHQMKLGGGQVANKPTAHGSGLAATPAGNNQMGGVGALKPAVASFVTRPPQLPAPGGGGAQKSKKKASELSDDSDGFGSSGLKKKKKKVASSNNLNFMDGLGGPKTNMTYNYTAEELGSVISSIKRGPGRPR